MAEFKSIALSAESLVADGQIVHCHEWIWVIGPEFSLLEAQGLLTEFQRLGMGPRAS